MQAVQAPDRIRPLRRVEYDKLVELGQFRGERIELLGGVLVRMSPVGTPRASTLQRLNVLLVRRFSHRAAVRCQLPFAAGEYSEPEPDFALVPSGDYVDEHPSVAHLVIEVSDSSLATDRGFKRELYAECGVPEYWVVNLVSGVLEVYRLGPDGKYAAPEELGPGAHVVPLAFGDATVAVDDVLR